MSHSRRLSKVALALVAVQFLAACSGTAVKHNPAPTVTSAQRPGVAYDIAGDFAGGGHAYDVLETLTVKDAINKMLDKHLSTIDLTSTQSYSNQVTRQDLQPLETRPAGFVKVVSICQAQLTDGGLESMQHLDPTNLVCNDNKLRDIPTAKHMTNLVELAVANNPISSRGFAVIAGLSKLRKLDLDITPVSDVDVDSFSRLSQLKLVSFKGCPNLSLRAVQKLRSQLPECQVTFAPEEDVQYRVGQNKLSSVEKTLIDDGELAEADVAFEKMINQWQLQKPVKYTLIAKAYRLRGDCQKRLNHLDTASRMYKKSVDIYLQHSPDHVELPHVELSCCDVLQRMKRMDEAEKMARLADSYWRKYPPRGGISIARDKDNRHWLEIVSRGRQH